MNNQTGATPTIRKKIHKGKKAQDKLVEGINIVADIIKETLCPKGRNVIVREAPFLQPRSMNDGHYIAQNIQSDDPTINAGIDMVKQICANTNDRVGDGTTTTAILCQALIKEGFKEIEGGKNPIDIKNEINDNLKVALAHLKSISKPLKTLDDIENIATISGNNDRAIGKAIRGIKEMLGWGAPIITEQHDKTELKVECIKGLYFTEGYGEAKGFVSNIPKRTAELVGSKDEKVYVLCYDEEMNDINEVQSFITNLQTIANEQKLDMSAFKLLVICKVAPLTSQAVEFFANNSKLKIMNKVDKNGAPLGFRNIVIEAPRTFGFQPDILEDIAIATKATVVGGKSGTRLRDVKPLEILGTAEKVIIGRKSTVIIGGGGDKPTIDQHIKSLKNELAIERMKEKKMSLEKRINMLGSGIGIIKAGGITAVEAKERELRLEDAILATKAAIEEGIVVGGGNAFWQIACKVKSKILQNACKSIPTQILLNSGKKPNDGTYSFMSIKKDYGFNALTGKYEDLTKAGVIDATKVVRVALENAVSFSSLLLTTSASIIDYEDNK